MPLPESASEPTTFLGKKYALPANKLKLETVSLERDAQSGLETLVLDVDGAPQRIACGRGKWHDTKAAWGVLPSQPAAVAGGWTGDAFTAKLCFYETPFVVTLRLKFSGDELALDSEQNVGFMLTNQPQIVGKRQ